MKWNDYEVVTVQLTHTHAACLDLSSLEVPPINLFSVAFGRTQGEAISHLLDDLLRQTRRAKV